MKMLGPWSRAIATSFLRGKGWVELLMVASSVSRGLRAGHSAHVRRAPGRPYGTRARLAGGRNSAGSAFCQAAGPTWATAGRQQRRVSGPRNAAISLLCAIDRGPKHRHDFRSSASDETARPTAPALMLKMTHATLGESHSPVVHELWVLVVAGSN